MAAVQNRIVCYTEDDVQKMAQANLRVDAGPNQSTFSTYIR